jgi:hypothetical protein
VKGRVSTTLIFERACALSAAAMTDWREVIVRRGAGAIYFLRGALSRLGRGFCCFISPVKPCEAHGSNREAGRTSSGDEALMPVEQRGQLVAIRSGQPATGRARSGLGRENSPARSVLHDRR